MAKRTIEQNRMYHNASRMRSTTAARKVSNYANSTYVREIKNLPQATGSSENKTSQSILAVLVGFAIGYALVAVAIMLFGEHIYSFISEAF